jgi:hypothetical protein
MPNIEQRYEAATGYARRALALVEDSPAFYNLIDRYAASVKTEPYRNDLARVEQRWLRASTDFDRARIARDAELVADRIQETLPGAPQDRQRTNLARGETPTSTPATSYAQEFWRQADELWTSAGSKAGSAGKWLFVVAGLVLGARLVGVWPAKRNERIGDALNRGLARLATERDREEP